MARTQKTFDKILALLHRHTGVDFSLYKEATLRRRTERRMTAHKFKSLDEYARYVQGHPAEVKSLFNDVLVNVTGFFRDPRAFETLKKGYFARLIRMKPSDNPIRIWVPACSTGEEVYSLAIILMELAGRKADA